MALGEALVTVLHKMMRARHAHLSLSDKGAARRLELSTFSRLPRHWVKGFEWLIIVIEIALNVKTGSLREVSLSRGISR